jgi:hypothetical protein
MPQANKPAMTSGPGALSQRTDGGPASKQAIRYVSGMPAYGDAQALMDMQASAPMAKTNNPPRPAPASSMQPQQGGQPMPQSAQQIVPLTAPTQRPDEPVTAGAPAGPGPGPEVLNLPSPDIAQYQTAKQGIQALAATPNASPALKALAQRFNQVF